jgi:hypothetical protein
VSEGCRKSVAARRQRPRSRFGILALTHGPQRVHRRKDTVVVVAAEEYERLVGQRSAFKDYLSQGESFEGLDLARDQSPGRDFPL